MPAAAAARPSLRAAARADNRIHLVLDAAARLFREKGYASTSMRDIAQASGMLAGSLYYHFPSKEALLVAVYGAGVAHITEAVSAALARDGDAWEKLENACAAHLEALLSGSDYAQVVVRVRPDDAPDVAAELTALRDGYERTFAQVIGALPLARPADRRTLKLLLLGALNWSQTWYRPGRDSPAVVARRFVRLLRDAQPA
jgi:AcrR family transcriptional regulator